MFEAITGNDSAKDFLLRMLKGNRVPGALLFAGEESVGKKLFALELARALNCRVRVGVEACGRCSSCQRTGKIAYPTSDKKEDYEKIHWSEHSDVGTVIPFNRSILVNAVRALESESNFRPVEGNARVFLIEEAHRLNDSASNALLKTLEEPHKTTHIILITSRPASLLPTIRSRCQTVRFSPLSIDEIQDHLVRERARAPKEAKLAAQFARGRIGAALSIDVDRHRERREQLLGVLEALSVTGDRSRLLRAAEDLSDQKNKDDYEPRLEILETLIRDLWLLSISGSNATLVNEDLRERLTKIAAQTESRRPARWLSRIEELRSQLVLNLNRRAATDALLLAMSAD